jgi:hypothetical protein
VKQLTPFDAPANQSHGASSEKDEAFWDGLDALLAETPHSPFHLLTHWPAYTKRITLIRFLAHYELFKNVIEMPGSIVELGVSRAVSFFTWHKLLEIFCPGDTSRKVYGFDSFEGLTDFSSKDGGDDAVHDKERGGWSAADVEHEIFRLNELHNADNVLARSRSVLVKGRVQETLPGFLEATPGLKIALLHFDLDLYEPTKYALDQLWDLVLPGGVVVFDEYALPPWGGETKAWDEFAAERGLTGVKIHKFPWSLTPNGFLIKE